MPRAKKQKTPDRSVFANIVTRKPDGDRHASVFLGGTAIYAPTEKQLNLAIDTVTSAIEAILQSHFMSPRSLLLKMVLDKVGDDLEERVFGAILGRSLRLGSVFAVPCLTSNANVLKVYLLAARAEELREKLNLVEELLRSSQAVGSWAAQRVCFPQRGWGTSFMSLQLLQHLAYRGRAVYADKDLFIWAREVADAVCSD